MNLWTTRKVGAHLLGRSGAVLVIALTACGPGGGSDSANPPSDPTTTGRVEVTRTTETPTTEAALQTTELSSAVATEPSATATSRAQSSWDFHPTNSEGWEWDGSIGIGYSLEFGKDVLISPPGQERLTSDVTSTWSWDVQGTQVVRTPPDVIPLGVRAFLPGDVDPPGSNPWCSLVTYDVPEAVGYEPLWNCQVGFDPSVPIQTGAAVSTYDRDETMIDSFLRARPIVEPGAYSLTFKMAREAGFEYTSCSLILFPNGSLVNLSLEECTIEGADVSSPTSDIPECALVADIANKLEAAADLDGEFAVFGEFATALAQTALTAPSELAGDLETLVIADTGSWSSLANLGDVPSALTRLKEACGA